MWYGIAAYSTWGLFPIYWKWLHHVPSLQLLCHRIVWSCLILTAMITVSRQGQALRLKASNLTVLRTYLLAALLIAVNWLVYIWAVNSNFIIETSLGYFINPLVSVFLGVIFLKEKLRPGQWLPIGIAAVGVLYLTILYGSLPWIALTLASSFGFYGLVKKTAPLSSLYGLTLETAFLFIPATLYLTYSDLIGHGAFLHTTLTSDLLLIGGGLVTTIPLLMFASAVQRVPLSVVGLLQYIAPTLQFILGVMVYHEPFSYAQLVGFALVWIALIIFAIEGYLAQQKSK